MLVSPQLNDGDAAYSDETRRHPSIDINPTRNVRTPIRIQRYTENSVLVTSRGTPRRSHRPSIEEYGRKDIHDWERKCRQP
ncbi:hypothetical protein RHA1_ro07059 [Rhodococcus jostii RHA1]|uniref:Uncharacterized protein n=1 Tax=Rhodococcus jostii (strain RHA1) TaxID=101510 RepID=Q0S0W1_RHOJR|nr:hypothetical protein RHA1_ro07059 [Rhodococcus jostii RHA1]